MSWIFSAMADRKNKTKSKRKFFQPSENVRQTWFHGGLMPKL
jgi:hypothetical protein